MAKWTEREKSKIQESYRIINGKSGETQSEHSESFFEIKQVQQQQAGFGISNAENVFCVYLFHACVAEFFVVVFVVSSATSAGGKPFAFV